MGKPKGRYVTLECPELKENILEAHQEVMEILTEELRNMIPLKDDTKTLVIGLGNRQVTADALGPLAVSGLLVTRHLCAVAPHELKERIRPVSAIAPGVMGQTGVETGELVAGLTDKIKPDVVIAIDALASRRTSRVNTTCLLYTSQVSRIGSMSGMPKIPAAKSVPSTRQRVSVESA